MYLHDPTHCRGYGGNGTSTKTSPEESSTLAVTLPGPITVMVIMEEKGSVTYLGAN